MDRRIVVFDVDDVLWNLNEKSAILANIDQRKLRVFNAYENTYITDEERNRLLDVYMGTELYENIQFNKQIVWLVNFIYHHYKEYHVMIVSNNASKVIRDIKLRQLREVLDLPEEDIHMNVIEITTGSTSKRLPDNVFILVDDSPHNIILGDAVHRVMPARRYNDVLVNAKLNGLRIDRPVTDQQLVNTVIHYLDEEK